MPVGAGVSREIGMARNCIPAGPAAAVGSGSVAGDAFSVTVDAQSVGDDAFSVINDTKRVVVGTFSVGDDAKSVAVDAFSVELDTFCVGFDGKSIKVGTFCRNLWGSGVGETVPGKSVPWASGAVRDAGATRTRSGSRGRSPHRPILFLRLLRLFAAHRFSRCRFRAVLHNRDGSLRASPDWSLPGAGA